MQFNLNEEEKREPMSEGFCPPGRDPVIEAYKRDIDLTLIRENIRLSIDERFLQLIEHQRLAEELKQAGRRVRQAQ